MFAYCGNNPISRIDDGGEFWHIVAGAAIGAAVSFASSIISDVITGEEIDWKGAGISAAFGATGGALAATGFGVIAQVTGGALLAAGENFIEQGREKGYDNVNYTEVAFNAILGGATSSANGLTKATAKHLNKQGLNATKRIASAIKHDGLKTVGHAIKSAGKYYISQTATLFYKPLIKSTADSMVDSLRTSVLESMVIAAY